MAGDGFLATPGVPVQPFPEFGEFVAARSPRLMRLPQYADLVAWAGEDGVERLSVATMRPWRVSVETQTILSEVGLPRFGSLFVPDPQADAQPLMDSMYLIGREQLHDHVASDNRSECECGRFGILERTGEVWEISPEESDTPLLVNSSLAQFVIFLNRLGAAKERYKNLRDVEMIPRFDKVIERLGKWDQAALSHPASFWQMTFDRAWG
jgi:hypothetical protein